MNKQKPITLVELVIIFFIITMLFLTILVTYLNLIKNYNTKSTKDNHFTIISIIDSEKVECVEESYEWIWNEKVTLTCGSIFIGNQIENFFQDTIKLKNPYNKGNAVYEVSSIPNVLKPGINYIMLNMDNNSVKVSTLLEYDGKLLETTKQFK